MKIAIMMRPMDQDSGFRAYTEALVENMLMLDRVNSYLLLYREPKWLGRIGKYANAKELLLKAPHKLLWDQVAVPWAAWRYRADIIFNPKFSVPLFSHCPVAMGLQEPAWWTWPDHYEAWDRRYEKIMLPLYIRKAAHLFPMSNFILGENRRVLGLPLNSVTVAYSAPDAQFRPITDLDVLASFRTRYQLPECYILSVTRVDHPGLEGSTSFYPGKNPETTFRAFARIRHAIPHKLVFAGRRLREYLRWSEGEDIDLTSVQFIEFVPYEELALLYNLADLFINPAPYEGCPNTLLQAMACGCPVVAARSGGCADVGKDAALLADPGNDADFAATINQVIGNDTLRQQLRQRSLARATCFSWETTARETIQGLVAAVERGRN